MCINHTCLYIWRKGYIFQVTATRTSRVTKYTQVFVLLVFMVSDRLASSLLSRNLLRISPPLIAPLLSQFAPKFCFRNFQFTFGSYGGLPYPSFGPHQHGTDWMRAPATMSMATNLIYAGPRHVSYKPTIPFVSVLRKAQVDPRGKFNFFGAKVNSHHIALPLTLHAPIRGVSLAF